MSKKRMLLYFLLIVIVGYILFTTGLIYPLSIVGIVIGFFIFYIRARDYFKKQEYLGS